MFFHKKTVDAEMADMHCHIIPGVDDGSPDMETTLAMLRIAHENNIHRMLVTPHYKNGHHNVSPQSLLRRIGEVEAACSAEGIEMKLFPGHEIFYFDGMEEALEEGKFCTMNDTDRVLIEFMPNEQFSYIRNALDKVRGMGYVPILAHVERYACMVDDWHRTAELKEMDIEIQVNAADITGALGGKVKSFVGTLLDQRLVDYVGTDAHDSKKRTPEAGKVLSYLYSKYDADYVRAITLENACALMDAE